MSPQRSPSASLDDALRSVGKVVAAAAGAGVFLYVVGAAAMWQRLAVAGLQSQEIVAAIPRDQLAVLGAREAIQSMYSGVVIVVCLWAGHRVFTQRIDCAEPAQRDLLAAFVTAIVAVVCLLVVPFDASSLFLLALFVTFVYVGIRSASHGLAEDAFRTSITPWLRVAASLAAALLVASISRQAEFPDPFLHATIVLENGQPHTIEGWYLGSNSNVVLLGRPGRSGREPCKTGAHEADVTPMTVMVARGRVNRIRLTDEHSTCAPPSSLLRRMGVVAIECVSPVCQVGDKRISLPGTVVKDKRAARPSPR